MMGFRRRTATGERGAAAGKVEAVPPTPVGVAVTPAVAERGAPEKRVVVAAKGLVQVAVRPVVDPAGAAIGAP